MMFSNLRKVWESVTPYLATVPTYPGALWTFALGTGEPVDPSSFDRTVCEDPFRGLPLLQPRDSRIVFLSTEFSHGAIRRGRTSTLTDENLSASG